MTHILVPRETLQQAFDLISKMRTVSPAQESDQMYVASKLKPLIDAPCEPTPVRTHSQKIALTTRYMRKETP